MGGVSDKSVGDVSDADFTLAHRQQQTLIERAAMEDSTTRKHDRRQESAAKDRKRGPWVLQTKEHAARTAYKRRDKIHWSMPRSSWS